MQGLIRIVNWGWNMVDDGVKNRCHRCFLVCWIVRQRRGPVDGRSINDREIQLIIICSQFDKEFEDFIHHFCWTSRWFVDFIDDHDRCQVLLQGLLQNETGLGHGSFVGINHQDNPVHHFHDPLNFSTEVRVSRCVQDIDSSSIVGNSRVFGQNGDAALFFDIV